MGCALNGILVVSTAAVNMIQQKYRSTQKCHNERSLKQQ